MGSDFDLHRFQILTRRPRDGFLEQLEEFLMDPSTAAHENGGRSELLLQFYSITIS